ncbi:Rv3235 family protein [Agromyces salentinus]|uniref:3-hydroxyacyl-CoA dehydrogenase n=1 Tax=Agromyces salentinus TaxID=269421 RepID=A0ABN2MW25_9MICO|nr:Rv3235 family protein [Agromyces salentinus]
MPARPAVRLDARASASYADDDEFFGRQLSRRSELPDPTGMLQSLTHCIVEAMAGARDLEQLARWVTDDVYRTLTKRVVLATRARRIKGLSPQRPTFRIGRVIVTEPADGVVEAVVLVHQPHRVRSIAIRLEGLDQRWRASAIAVL